MKFYKPEIKDLWYRQSLVENEETMSFNDINGGIFPFSESKWDMWYKKWILDPNYYYRYIQNENDDYVGEVSYVLTDEEDTCLVFIIVEANQRNKGYGTKALEELLKVIKENEIKKVIVEDNDSSLFERNGFMKEQDYFVKQL